MDFLTMLVINDEAYIGKYNKTSLSSTMTLEVVGMEEIDNLYEIVVGVVEAVKVGEETWICHWIPFLD